jgi:hypothetical protein
VEGKAGAVAVLELLLGGRSTWPFIARIQPIFEQMTVIGSRSIIAS